MTPRLPVAGQRVVLTPVGQLEERGQLPHTDLGLHSSAPHTLGMQWDLRSSVNGSVKSRNLKLKWLHSKCPQGQAHLNRGESGRLLYVHDVGCGGDHTQTSCHSWWAVAHNLPLSGLITLLSVRCLGARRGRGCAETSRRVVAKMSFVFFIE